MKTSLLSLFRHSGLSLAAMLAAAIASPASAANFKPEWKVGKEYLFESTVDTQMQITTPVSPDGTLQSPYLPNLQPQIKATQTTGLGVLKAREGGGHVIRMTILKSTSSSPVPVPSMEGAQLTFHTDENGKVVELEGAKSFIEKMSSGNPLVAQFLNEEALKQMFFTFTVARPDREVKQGESWKFSASEGRLGLKTKLAGTHTWKETAKRAGRECARLETQGKVEVDLAETPNQATFEKGSIQGTSWVDLAEGIPVETDSTVEMKMTSAQGQNISMEIKTHTQQKLVEVKNL